MALNVLGTELKSCSTNPMTGFFRNGCCDTNYEDEGMHTVCIEATDSFLEYSKQMGNDLSTPVSDWQFPGLKAGDRWCLCLQRWIQAYNDGSAPNVFLEGTHISALEFIDLKTLEGYAAKG